MKARAKSCMFARALGHWCVCVRARVCNTKTRADWMAGPSATATAQEDEDEDEDDAFEERSQSAACAHERQRQRTEDRDRERERRERKCVLCRCCVCACASQDSVSLAQCSHPHVHLKNKTQAEAREGARDERMDSIRNVGPGAAFAEQHLLAPSSISVDSWAGAPLHARQMEHADQ